MRKISEQELIEALNELSESIGDIPTSEDMANEGQYSAAVYVKRFGGWKQALFASDIIESDNYDPNRIPKEQLLQHLRELAEKIGGTPTADQMDAIGEFNHKTYARRFGSWNSALSEAGLEVNRESVVGISDDELLNGIEEMAEQLGKRPTIPEMEEYGDYSPWVYFSRFDSWKSACEEAGFEYEHAQRISREELLDELSRLAEEIDATPTREDMTSEGRFSPRPYIREFGSWNNALREVGFEPTHRINISDEELLEGIKKLAEELGRPPTSPEMESMGRFSMIVYPRRFGSWNKALEMAGYEIHLPRKAHDKSNEELLEEIRRLRDDLDRRPTITDMDERGAYSSKVYRSRFDSWNNAIEEAGLEPRQFPFEGEDNPQWKGGLVTEYGSNWQAQREERLKMDDFECKICGLSNSEHVEQFGMGLHVHHITPIREFDEPVQANDLSNLITLCLPCHNEWEGVGVLPERS